MAQGTGQARRQRGGTEKASGRKSATRTRGGNTTRQRAKTSGKATGSKASASGSSRSKASASNSSRAKTSGSRSKASSSKASGSRSKAGGSSAARNGRATSRTKSSTAKSVARKAKKPASRASKRVKQARTLLQTGRRAAQAVVPVAKRVPALAEHVRSAAAPAGAAGASLAAAGAAVQALRRSRQPEPRLTRWGKAAAKAATKVPPRGGKRHVPDPPRIPDLRIPDIRSIRPDSLWLAAIPAGIEATKLLRQTRRIPIQQCVDIAVPLQVVYDEWMRLDFLPEGAHTAEKIERAEDDRLKGKIRGPAWSRNWEAEIRDDRECESFAWRSVKGSDCAGLVTFHELGERLTRLELQLDIVPVRPLEAAEFTLHLADTRARNELRRFKARLETISPDAYDLEGMS